VQVVITATSPFSFTLRRLSAPERLVVDLRGIEVSALNGAQEVNLPPVRVVRLARGSGFVQVVIELAEPVLADISLAPDARTLTLRLERTGTVSTVAAPAPPPSVVPGAVTPRGPPPATASPTLASTLPTDVIRLRHLKARDVAAHLQTLLPGLVARVDEGTNSLLLTGTPEMLAQAKHLVAALDTPPLTTPVTDVIALKVLKSEVLAPILATMFPQAQVRAEPRLNAIVLTATPALLDRVKAVITALDVPQATPAGPATEIFTLQHADPAQVASLLAGAVPQAQIRVDPATRTLTITAPPAAITQVKTLLQQFDAPSPTAPASEIVRVRSGDPDAVARALRQAFPTLTVTADRGLGAVILQGPRADVERAKAMLAALETQPPAVSPSQLQVEVIPIRHAMPSEFATEPSTSRSAEDLAQTVQAALQPIYPELKITTERRLQALVATGTAAAIAAVRDLVARLDLPSPQVALEVRVVEVAANALQNLGISLSPIVGSTLTEQDPNNRPFIFGRTPLNITVILNLLVERGQGKILANPTLATIDGRKALIRTGDDIPLVTRQIFGNTVIENVITFRAGVTLEILPKISSDGHITVLLRPIVSTITGTTPQGAPQISTREVQTTLMVRDGETIVIGGLLEERDLVSMSRIPGLSELPFLGRLFRSERRERRRTELVITVTPRRLPPTPQIPPGPPAPPTAPPAQP
jgi:type II secretory pathway component GspD/PulD (secretin)